MIMILDVDVTAERRHYNTHRLRGRYHHPLNLLNLLNLDTEGVSNGEDATANLGPKGRQLSEPLGPKGPSILITLITRKGATERRYPIEHRKNSFCRQKEEETPY